MAKLLWVALGIVMLTCCAFALEVEVVDSNGGTTTFNTETGTTTHCEKIQLSDGTVSWICS